MISMTKNYWPSSLPSVNGNITWKGLISKTITLRSVGSVGLTHLAQERKSRISMQPPDHTTDLTQPDREPNLQDTREAGPNTYDIPDAASHTLDAP